MNLQWGDKGIGWCDATWNPVTGCLSTASQCAVQEVCYARGISLRFGRSFKPTFHPERLNEPYKLKKPAKIFISSMGELFGPWVPREWQEAVLNVAIDNPHHTFQFLTKFPCGAIPFEFPPNAWMGVTINEEADSWRSDVLCDIEAETLFISAEPLLDRLAMGDLLGIDWLIIGAQTNPSEQPHPKWIKALLEEADDLGVAVFMKKELNYEPKRREWPSQGDAVPQALVPSIRGRSPKGKGEEDE